MNLTESRAGTVKRIGGRLSLDFTNTVDLHVGDYPEERIKRYEDFVAWGWHVGLLTEGEAESLLKAADLRPQESAKALERAIALRETIYRIFSAFSQGHSPSETDLATFNASLSDAQSRSIIVRTQNGFTWGFPDTVDPLERVFWHVVHDAADLLTSDDLSRVRECGGEKCGWLFFDQSRNHSRRWCSMEDCGNTAKARRFYRRKRPIA